jgi:hypothetical protein
MSTITFLAQYSFKGNNLAGLLSFRAGEKLIVTDPNKSDVNGWAYGHLASSTDPTKQLGWFPLAHMKSVKQPNQGRHQSRSEMKPQKHLLSRSCSTAYSTDFGRGRELVDEKPVALSSIEEGEDEGEDVTFVFDWRRIH